MEIVLITVPTSPRCLILGASGFIGRHLVRRMADQGLAVRAMSRSREPSFESPHVEWIAGNPLDPEAVGAVLEGCESCVQLVTTTKPGTANGNMSYDISSNLINNVRIMQKLGQQPDMKFVYLSSGGTVYGNPLYVPIKEAHPTEPFSSYGITKLAIEKYIQMFVRLNRFKASILRVSNPFGEFQSFTDGQGVVPTFLWKVLNREAIEIWGDGLAVRDYIYVGDVCDAIIAALGYRGDKVVFNIGFGRGLSVLEILKGIEETVGFSTEVKHLDARPTDVQVSVLDNTLAFEELGWTPQTSFYEGLERTARWIERRWCSGSELSIQPKQREQQF
ncbi:NAD-dependent epimerase/dehydratase family protein [uncultured Paracoccus sp.]|uniref:NAD-dependent epimerase/dehydratase family protein n=1 Tax=uncultured Paracoccus sp. TaxID=189685 RepID=UPI00341B8808